MPTRSSSEGRRGWKIPRAIARRVKVSLFDRSAVSSSRPVVAMTSRADAVKAGRCCAVASYSAVARPRLDGGEHDVMLGWSGHRKKSRGTVFFNGCYGLVCSRRAILWQDQSGDRFVFVEKHGMQ